MAYNRDEAEVFGLEKALAAGYDELYSTAQEVIDKRIIALDKEIQAKAIEKAEDTVARVRTAKERKLEERQVKMEDIVDEMAKMIIQENKAYIGKEVANEAIEEISKKGRKKNEKQEKTEEKEEKQNEETTKRTRKKTSKTA